MRTCNGEGCTVYSFRKHTEALGMAYSSTLKKVAGFSETLVKLLADYMASYPRTE
jgi:hypothetical protein